MENFFFSFVLFHIIYICEIHRIFLFYDFATQVEVEFSRVAHQTSKSFCVLFTRLFHYVHFNSFRIQFFSFIFIVHISSEFQKFWLFKFHIFLFSLFFSLGKNENEEELRKLLNFKFTRFSWFDEEWRVTKAEKFFTKNN